MAEVAKSHLRHTHLRVKKVGWRKRAELVVVRIDLRPNMTRSTETYTTGGYFSEQTQLVPTTISEHVPSVLSASDSNPSWVVLSADRSKVDRLCFDEELLLCINASNCLGVETNWAFQNI